MDFNLINILLVILIIAAIFFLVYGIIFLRKLESRIDDVTEEVRELSSRTKPLLDGLQEVNIKLLKVSSDFEILILNSNQTINSVKIVVDTLLEKIARKGKFNPFSKLFKRKSSEED